MQQLRWVDRTGEIGETIGVPQSDVRSPALSPDGRRVAVSAMDGTSSNIFSYDTVRGTRTRLRFDSEVSDYQPAWSPTGDQIVIDSDNSPHYSDLIVVDTDGSEEARALDLGHNMVGCPDWSKDGRFLVYHVKEQGRGTDLWRYDFTDDQPAQVFLQRPFNTQMPVISPNGSFVAYQSNESGDWEIYVTRFPDGKGKWQVSVDGGMHPRWNGEGDELFYVETGTDMLMSVSVETVDVFQMDLPQKLFKVNNPNHSTRQKIKKTCTI
jgi:Tol biopolymer transport system component